MKTKSALFAIFAAATLFAVQNVSAGTVTGQVFYEGEAPKLRKIDMSSDPICINLHADPVHPKTIILGPNKELKNVFIQVTQGVPNKEYSAPSEPFVIDQAGCMYDPPVFGVQAGQPVKFLNPDGTLHNVHALTKINPEFNIAMPKFRKEVVKTFEKPEEWFQIKCDVHPWMVTHGNVLSHPYFAVTDAEGRFTIDDLPPGEYVIEARQQRLPPQTKTVTVADGETKEVSFTFSRPGK